MTGIGAIIADDPSGAQRVLAAAAARWQARLRIVGLVEEALAGDARRPGTVVSLGDGRRFSIRQRLGADARGCTLDSAALVEAGQWISARIAAGCDLVVLSKFGRMEAELGGGLIAPLTVALDREIPVLLAVSQRFGAAWTAFSGGLATMVAPEAAAVDGWIAANVKRAQA